MKFINLLFLIILLSNNLFSQQELHDFFTIKFIDNLDEDIPVVVNDTFKNIRDYNFNGLVLRPLI